MKHSAQLELKKLHTLYPDLPLKLKEAEWKYAYQEKLTDKLDNHKDDFTELTLLEIVLWKTNRYPEITENLLAGINNLRKSYSEESARALLRNLLDLKGFDLPMASTVLRFALPDQFQIIEQRVCRLITPNEPHLKIPYNKEKRIDLYFDYIKQLKTLCETQNIPFQKADRILYQLDKIENKNITETVCPEDSSKVHCQFQQGTAGKVKLWMFDVFPAGPPCHPVEVKN